MCAACLNSLCCYSYASSASIEHQPLPAQHQQWSRPDQLVRHMLQFATSTVLALYARRTSPAPISRWAGSLDMSTLPVSSHSCSQDAASACQAALLPQACDTPAHRTRFLSWILKLYTGHTCHPPHGCTDVGTTVWRPRSALAQLQRVVDHPIEHSHPRRNAIYQCMCQHSPVTAVQTFPASLS